MADADVVLQTFEFKPDSKDVILEMRGRPTGLTRWLLSAMKIDTTTYLIVTRSNVQFRWSGLGGQTTIMCPSDTVRSMLGGTSKPMWMVGLGVLAIGLGLAALSSSNILPGLVMLGIAVGLFVGFVMSKGLTIAFSTSDFIDVHGLVFDAKLPNGKVVKEEELLRIIEHINLNILGAHRSAGGRRAAPQRRPTAEVSSVEAREEASLPQKMNIPIEVESPIASVDETPTVSERPEGFNQRLNGSQQTNDKLRQTEEMRRIEEETIFEFDDGFDDDDDDGWLSTNTDEPVPTMIDLKNWFEAGAYDAVVDGATRLFDAEPQNLAALKARISANTKLDNTVLVIQDRAELERLQAMN